MQAGREQPPGLRHVRGEFASLRHNCDHRLVPELGPLTIAARTRDQAEYLIRSRAEQRGVRLHGLDVSDAGHGVWSVTVVVEDDDIEKLATAALDQDTQVMHFRNHPRRQHPGAS